MIYYYQALGYQAHIYMYCVLNQNKQIQIYALWKFQFQIYFDFKLNKPKEQTQLRLSFNFRALIFNNSIFVNFVGQPSLESKIKKKWSQIEDTDSLTLTQLTVLGRLTPLLHFKLKDSVNKIRNQTLHTYIINNKM